MDGLMPTWNKDNPDKHRAYNAAWRRANPTTRANWLARHLPFIRARALKRGLPFDLSPDCIYVPAVCPVLGAPLVFGGKLASDFSPSLDRVNPALGYVRSNIAVISRRANMLKNNATAAELYAVAAWVENFHG